MVVFALPLTTTFDAVKKPLILDVATCRSISSSSAAAVKVVAGDPVWFPQSPTLPGRVVWSKNALLSYLHKAYNRCQWLLKVLLHSLCLLRHNVLVSFISFCLLLWFVTAHLWRTQMAKFLFGMLWIVNRFANLLPACCYDGVLLKGDFTRQIFFARIL